MAQIYVGITLKHLFSSEMMSKQIETRGCSQTTLISLINVEVGMNVEGVQKLQNQ